MAAYLSLSCPHCLLQGSLGDVNTATAAGRLRKSHFVVHHSCSYDLRIVSSHPFCGIRGAVKASVRRKIAISREGEGDKLWREYFPLQMQMRQRIYGLCIGLFFCAGSLNQVQDFFTAFLWLKNLGDPFCCAYD